MIFIIVFSGMFQTNFARKLLIHLGGKATGSVKKLLNNAVGTRNSITNPPAEGGEMVQAFQNVASLNEQQARQNSGDANYYLKLLIFFFTWLTTHICGMHLLKRKHQSQQMT
jgi:hypothetical protein